MTYSVALVQGDRAYLNFGVGRYQTLKDFSSLTEDELVEVIAEKRPTLPEDISREVARNIFIITDWALDTMDTINTADANPSMVRVTFRADRPGINVLVSGEDPEMIVDYDTHLDTRDDDDLPTVNGPAVTLQRIFDPTDEVEDIMPLDEHESPEARLRRDGYTRLARWMNNVQVPVDAIEEIAKHLDHGPFTGGSS